MIVVDQDGNRVFVTGGIYDDYIVFDVASGSIEELEGVEAVASLGPNGVPRLFASADQYWAYGESPPSNNRRGDPWKGPVNADGRYAVRTQKIEGSYDGYPVLVDVEAKKGVRKLEAGGRTADEFTYFFSPDGALLFGHFASIEGSSGGGLAVWEAATGAERVFLPDIEGYSSAWTHHFSTDGHVFMVEDSRDVKVFRLTGTSADQINVSGLGRTSGPRTLAKDGSAIFEAGEDGTVTVLSVAGIAGPKTLRASTEPLTFITASPDGKYVAVADVGRTLTILSSADGMIYQAIPLLADVLDVRFLPGDKLVFVADVDGGMATVPLLPGSSITADSRTFVDWLRATRHSVVTDADRALFGLTTSTRKERPDLAGLASFPIPAKRDNPAPSEAAAECDRFTANPFDRDRRATGVAFVQLDAAAAMPVCQQALDLNPNDLQTRYQVARLHDRLEHLLPAYEGYRIAADQGYAVAMRGIARLIEIDKTGQLTQAGTIEAWMNRAANAGDPWALASLATDTVLEAPANEGIEAGLSILAAAGVINRAQAAMTLASRIHQKIDAPEAHDKVRFLAMLALHLNDTTSDPAPFGDYQMASWIIDYVRNQGHKAEPEQLVEIYRRARDWRVSPEQ